MTQKLPPKLNAATHWMTSREPLIPGESRESLLAHLEHWNRLYPGVETDELLSDLVREAAFEQWLLYRYQRQYDKTLAILYKTEMDDWTPEQHKTYQLRERYLNSVQRRFNRHRSNILQYQSNLRAQAREDRAANDYAGGSSTKKQPANKPKKEEPAPPAYVKHEGPILQRIYVSQENGLTQTRFSPDNQTILEITGPRLTETAVIVRTIDFRDNIIPPEYEAFAPRYAQRENVEDSLDVAITFRNWRIAIEREKKLGGHVRNWPDLRAQDEEFIQKALARDRQLYADHTAKHQPKE